MMPQSEGGEAWEEATDFGVHANENKKVNSDRTETGAADPEDVLRAVFLGLSFELLRCPKWVLPPSFLKTK